jgi:indolepyruvate ferredoxin oxidoreductase beta subunit
MPTTQNFLLAGVGGQGTLLAADVVSLVGMAQGYDVKKSEVHGMAQRGGSVTSHVRWGERVYSPLITPGEVDFFVAFERLEGLRYASLLRSTGALLVNDYRIAPISVSSGNGRYPSSEDEDGAYQGAIARRYLVPAMAMAGEIGNARVNNVIMLGALSALIDVPAERWEAVIAERVPARFVGLNRQAFAVGRDFLLRQLP